MKRSFIGVLVLALAPAVASATTIADWDNIWLQAIRDTGGPPGPIARAGAMVHVAMFNAVNATTGHYESYQFSHALDTTALADVAAAQAAHDVLVHLYPALAANFDTALNTQLGLVPNSAGKTAGIALGQSAAQSMITLRSADGSNVVTPYVPGSNPGDWRPTPDDFTPAAGPGWGLVTPWAMTSGNQFDPGLPGGATTMTQLLTSAEYTAAFNDVKEKGTLDLLNTTRTAEETDIASFWANDRDGTYKPPGQLNEIAQVLSAQHGLNLEEEARLFALVNLSLGDASIAAWDVKYDTDVDFWRPVTAIQLADTDGNPLTDVDPNWLPWSQDPLINGFTPPFPAYISGHATFGAAASAIFTGLFGDNNMGMLFTFGTDDPGYTGVALRTYDSFETIAKENGRSRIYLGVHWQFDADMGYIAGTDVGNNAFNSVLRPVPEPTTLIGGAMGLAALALGLRRRCR